VGGARYSGCGGELRKKDRGQGRGCRAEGGQSHAGEAIGADGLRTKFVLLFILFRSRDLNTESEKRLDHGGGWGVDNHMTPWRRGKKPASQFVGAEDWECMCICVCIYLRWGRGGLVRPPLIWS
jgi:hypothetical protein